VPGEQAGFVARGLTKVYEMGEVRVEALRGIDFDLFPGEQGRASPRWSTFFLQKLGRLDLMGDVMRKCDMMYCQSHNVVPQYKPLIDRISSVDTDLLSHQELTPAFARALHNDASWRA
jgi:hypothetical protein